MSPVLPVTIPPSRVDRAHQQKPGRPLVMSARDELGQWLVIDPGAPFMEVARWPRWETAYRDAEELVAERRARESHMAAVSE